MAKESHQKKIKDEKDRQYLEKLLREFQTTGYYGSMEMKFEDGRLVHTAKHQSLKPPSY